MKKMILCSLLFSGVCFADPNDTSSDVQYIAQIDQEIQDLRNEKARCQMGATEASDDADRFMDLNDWVSYREQVARQSSMQQQMRGIDAEITQLEQKKEKALQQ